MFRRPKPVCCELSPEKPLPNVGFVDGALLFGWPEGNVGWDCSFGVLGADCGIGGNDSNSAAPNEEDGLKALIPLNPVFCGCNGAAEEIEIDGAADAAVVAVAPVG